MENESRTGSSLLNQSSGKNKNVHSAENLAQKDCQKEFGNAKNATKPLPEELIIWNRKI